MHLTLPCTARPQIFDATSINPALQPQTSTPDFGTCNLTRCSTIFRGIVVNVHPQIQLSCCVILPQDRYLDNEGGDHEGYNKLRSPLVILSKFEIHLEGFEGLTIPIKAPTSIRSAPPIKALPWSIAYCARRNLAAPMILTIIATPKQEQANGFPTSRKSSGCGSIVGAEKM